MPKAPRVRSALDELREYAEQEEEVPKFQKGGLAKSAEGSPLDGLKEFMSRVGLGVESQWSDVNPHTGELQNFFTAGPGPESPLRYRLIDPFAETLQYRDRETGEIVDKATRDAYRERLNQEAHPVVPGLVRETATFPFDMVDAYDAITGREEPRDMPDTIRNWQDRNALTYENLQDEYGLDQAHGIKEHAGESLGIMLGQLPVPTAWLRGAGTGLMRKILTSPLEWVSPIVDPRLGSYAAGTAFGTGMNVGMDKLAEGAIQEEIDKLITSGEISPEEAELLLDLYLGRIELPEGYAKGGRVKPKLDHVESLRHALDLLAAGQSTPESDAWLQHFVEDMRAHTPETGGLTYEELLEMLQEGRQNERDAATKHAKGGRIRPFRGARFSREGLDSVHPENRRILSEDFLGQGLTGHPLTENIGKRARIIRAEYPAEQDGFTIIGVQRMWGHDAEGNYRPDMIGYRVVADRDSNGFGRLILPENLELMGDDFVYDADPELVEATRASGRISEDTPQEEIDAALDRLGSFRRPQQYPINDALRPRMEEISRIFNESSPEPYEVRETREGIGIFDPRGNLLETIRSADDWQAILDELNGPPQQDLPFAKGGRVRPPDMMELRRTIEELMSGTGVEGTGREVAEASPMDPSAVAATEGAPTLAEIEQLASESQGEPSFELPPVSRRDVLRTAAGALSPIKVDPSSLIEDLGTFTPTMEGASTGSIAATLSPAAMAAKLQNAWNWIYESSDEIEFGLAAKELEGVPGLEDLAASLKRADSEYDRVTEDPDDNMDLMDDLMGRFTFAAEDNGILKLDDLEGLEESFGTRFVEPLFVNSKKYWDEIAEDLDPSEQENFRRWLQSFEGQEDRVLAEYFENGGQSREVSEEYLNQFGLDISIQDLISETFEDGYLEGPIQSLADWSLVPSDLRQELHEVYRKIEEMDPEVWLRNSRGAGKKLKQERDEIVERIREYIDIEDED